MSNAHGEGLKIADDLRTFIGINGGDFAQVTRVRLDRLPVSLEPHGAKAHVAKNFGGSRKIIGGLEFAIRLLHLLPFGILEERDASRKVSTRFITDAGRIRHACRWRGSGR